MAYKTVSFEKRIKENIKNYSLHNLYPIEILTEYLKSLKAVTGFEFLLTDHYGEKVVSLGDFREFDGDVMRNPGKKIRVCDRAVGHLYCKAPEGKEDVQASEGLIDRTIELLERMGEQTYLHTESSFYIDELEEKENLQKQIRSHGEKVDPLTGVLNSTYFAKRLEIVDRSEVIPVGVVNCNINDWKYVNDNFGDEESDRLIRVIAGIIREESKPEYIVGRVDGDVFVTLIPMADDLEAEEYAARIQKKCMEFEDVILAPSVACGVVYKTNVEEKLEDKLSDAEYEMFQNKIDIKSAPGYRDRLEKNF